MLKSKASERVKIYLVAIILLLGSISCIYASDIPPEGYVLENIDKYIEKTRKSINDPLALSYYLNAALIQVMGHPKVFPVLEEIVIKSTSPGCVSLALKYVANHYYLSDIDPRAVDAQISLKHQKKALKLLKRSLHHQSLWVRKTAVLLMLDKKGKDSKEKDLAYKVLLDLAEERDWEKKLDQELPNVLSAMGASPLPELGGKEAILWYKAVYLLGVLDSLFEIQTSEARASLKQLSSDVRVIQILEMVSSGIKYHDTPSHKAGFEGILKKLRGF